MKAEVQNSLFGLEAVVHAPAKKSSPVEPKAKQLTLFAGLDAPAGQMNLFADNGIPDEMVYKPVESPVDSSPALFIPLKTEYYEAFCDGSKTVECRKYGKGWNEKTCTIGKKVVISKGYGKQNRKSGVIVGFTKQVMDSEAWIDCYGEPGLAACIEIKLQD